MKCVRNTGWGVSFNKWQAMCKKAQRDARKKYHWDYEQLSYALPRYRTRKKALAAIRRSSAFNIYWRTRYRLAHKNNKAYWGCK